MQIGRYYQKRLDIGVAMLQHGYEMEVDKISERFVEFPELDMKWPEIAQCKTIDDAKTLFRLANTQYKRALERFVLDGFVSEHVVIKQGISQLYRSLTRIETDASRATLMQQRRIEMLEFLAGELNPNTYQVRQMEFAAELADIYGEVYELELLKPRKNAAELNRLAEKSMKNGRYFCDIIYKKDDPEDKFAYHQAMLNLELSIGSKLTKVITADPKERIDKTRQALALYKKLDQYMREYMQHAEVKSLD